MQNYKVFLQISRSSNYILELGFGHHIDAHFHKPNQLEKYKLGLRMISG